MPTLKLPRIGAVSFFVFFWAGLAFGMGQKPVTPPTGILPDSGFVEGFTPSDNSQAFRNYHLWEKSGAPEYMQLAHCTGMSLFARQVFYWGEFHPELPPLTYADYRSILTRIYHTATQALPGTKRKVTIPGFKNWNQLSSDPQIESIVKNILGNAINDIFHPNWNWSIFDAFGNNFRSNTEIELVIRETVSKGRFTMLYLTNGFKTAHCVLVYAYTVLSDRTRYWVYDSNYPGVAYSIDFIYSDAKFYHPDWGWRDPWILHPYQDEPNSTEASLKALR